MLWSDLRYGFRVLMRTPTFTLTAVVALALGIGANTAMFSAIDRILLQPLPYGDPERLVQVWEDASFVSFPRNTPAPGNFYDWKRMNTVFSDMAATRSRSASATGGGQPEQLNGRGVTHNFFSVLGVAPMLGRTFTEEEETSNARVVVISHGLWQRRFGGDARIVGRNVAMNDQQFIVSGVMPKGFYFPEPDIDFWAPTGIAQSDRGGRGSHFLTVIARLKPGVTVRQAQSEMTAIAKRLEEQYPGTNAKVGAEVVPLREQMVGKTRIALYVLFGGAGCVLLIACANLANLLLARAASRRREVAVRIALGAGRGRLIRQMLTESILLSLAGGCLGLLFAEWGAVVLEKLIPTAIGGALQVSGDPRILLFALGVSCLTGVIFGLVPALQTSRLSLHDALKQGARGSTEGVSLFRNGLVVAETALAIVLLAGAGMLIQALVQLRAIDLGFEPAGLLTMRSTLPHPKYAEASRRAAFYDGVRDRVRALPGVTSVGFVSQVPFSTIGNTVGFRVEGAPPPRPGSGEDTLLRPMTPDYLRAIGARLREGRFLEERDRAVNVPAMIVNETFADLYWPNRTALGGHVKLSFQKEADTWFTVIGVVRDIRERGLDIPMKPAAYVLTEHYQGMFPSFLAVRTSGDPKTLVAAVRNAIQSVDKDQPVYLIRTMDEWLKLQVANREQQITILGAFAALALLLASLGIYGVLSYVVAQRTREIGVRMALGASAATVSRMVVGQGLRLTALGLVLGLGGALLLTRAIESLLYEVKPNDPTVYAGVAFILLAVSLAACWIPAYRASRVDPLVALRDD